jgi:RNA polymerase primary sigma factor
MKATKPRAVQGVFDSYLSEIDATPLLSRAKERELAIRIADGDVEARDEMVRANLRLVVCIARQYAGKGLPMEDLVAEGNMGLLRAVEGFDADAGTRFSTYAAFWIRQSIRRALNMSGGVTRLPTYMNTMLTKWQREKAALHRELGRPPEDEAVARKLGLTRRQFTAVRQALKVTESNKWQEREDNLRLDHLAADATSVAPDARITGAEDVRRMLELVGDLNHREATIVRMRFGLDGAESKTLKEIGRHLGLTRERVRQIELDVLGRLKGHILAA